MDTQNNTNIALHLTLLFAILIVSGFLWNSLNHTDKISDFLIWGFYALFLVFLPLFAFASILVYRDLNTIATANSASLAAKIILSLHILLGLTGIILVYFAISSMAHGFLRIDFAKFFILMLILVVGLKLIHVNLYKKLKSGKL